MSDYKLEIDIGKRVTVLRDVYGNTPSTDTSLGYIFDFDVGSNVEVNGINLKVVEDKSINDICKDCVLRININYDNLPEEVKFILCEKSKCVNYLRRDGKTVHYEEVKNERE